MKRTALCGIMVAMALIFSFIETLIPIPIGIPGIKLGLANVVILYSLYKLSWMEAFLINIVRIILSGLMFGSFMALLYSLSGALLSLLVMILLVKKMDFHIITVSVAGAISHIAGQMIVASFVVGIRSIAFYLAPLLASALVTGTIIGILCSILISRIPFDM